MSHSWTGNLVTNASWEHFWLNEGWTVWMERNLVTRAAGGGADGGALYGLHALCGVKALREDITHQTARPELTRLVPSLAGGVDPDDAFSRVPYEKGFLLLSHLAQQLGGDEPMRAFFRAYIQKFKARAISTDDFCEFALHWADASGRGAQVRAIDWQRWLHAPGMPPSIAPFDESLALASAQLASRWAMGQAADGSPADVRGWSSLQRQVFLDKLLDEVRAARDGGAGRAPLGDAELQRLASLYAFGSAAGDQRGAVNCEEAFRFYRLCLAQSGGGTSFLREILSFLKSNGRMKYVRPLFRDLCQSEEGRAAALPAFQAWRANYHPIAQHMLALDLGLRA